MRRFRPALLLLTVLWLSASVASHAQALKDSMAVTVLTQMYAATGWNPASVPRDAVATGSVTRFRGQAVDTVSVTWKARGPRQHRADVQATAGATSTIVNGDSGAVVTPNGPRFIPSHSALSMQPLDFPFYSDLISANDPNVGLHYAGTETVGSQLAHRVEIAREAPAGHPLAAVRHRAGHLTVWVSTSTWLPVQIEYVRIANDNPTAARSSIRTFSDHRVVNGLAVPFHQEEFAGTQRLYTLQLNSVSFNVGLSDADFALPAAQP